jgi:hypothetical protein
MDDTHFDPAKHGRAARPAVWPFASFAKRVTLGQSPIDCAIEGPGLADAGERS